MILSDSLPSAECIALHKMYAALDVSARSRRNKPFPANKRDDLRVIQAYRSVCICAGNIMCSGEGEYLLGRVDWKNQKKIPHPKMEIFILSKNKIEKVYESDLNDIEPSLVKEQMLLLLQSSCQICKQYAYVPKYFRAHNGRALWEGHACAKLSKQLLSHELNPTRSKFLLRTDHWSE